MRKAVLIIIGMMLLTSVSMAMDIKIEIKGHYFNPSNQDFKDIYGGGFMYGGEAALGIPGNFDFFLAAAFLSQTGELTFSGEETEINLIPIRAGVKYLVHLTESVDFYLGGGISYYLYEEINPIGEVSDSGLGYMGTAGINVFLSENFFIDVFGSYSTCKVQPSEFEVDIGGLDAGCGFGFRF